MYKDLKSPVLIVHYDIKADTVVSERVWGIAHELKQDDFSTFSTASPTEGRIIASIHHDLAYILVIAEGTEKGQHLLQDVVELIRVARVRAPQLPIFALSEQVTIEDAPAEFTADLYQSRGILYPFENTVPLLACQVAWVAHNYLAGLLPPSSRALVKHTAQSNYSQHTPGHGDGVIYCKSPVGQAFHQFFGENALRSDLPISVPELDLLLDHIDPLAETEDRAARNLSADHTFFVINGTSATNKIVWHSMTGCEDPVLVDRNYHKSILHSIIVTGAIPLYLTPERNGLRIIGPTPLSGSSKESIVARVVASPLVCSRRPKVRLVVVTNSIYDGPYYNAELIRQTLGDSVEMLHFDEAWYAYAVFHESYDKRYGIDTPRSEEGPLVLAIRSTHKMLAAFSQVSMIHMQDGGTRRLDMVRLNETFMIHTSISPQYDTIASLDVASVMMEGPARRSLAQETFDETLNFRRALANIRRSLDRNDWRSDVWQPEQVEGTDRVGAYDWMLEPSVNWHDFGDIVEDYMLLDPIRATLATPSLSAGGRLGEQGIPAVIVSRFFWERGLVVERTGLYPFLALFSMGTTKGKWNALITELLEFKRCYDINLPLLDALPSVVQAGDKRYNGVGLYDLSDAIHASYCDNATAKVMKRIYTMPPEIAIWPSEAYDKLVRSEVEAVPIARLGGRIAAVTLVPYSPDIPLTTPGGCLAGVTRSILDCLEFTRTFEHTFLDFDSDVHGLQYQDEPSGRRYTVKYIEK